MLLAAPAPRREVAGARLRAYSRRSAEDPQPQATAARLTRAAETGAAIGASGNTRTTTVRLRLGGIRQDRRQSADALGDARPLNMSDKRLDRVVFIGVAETCRVRIQDTGWMTSRRRDENRSQASPP